MPSNDRPRVLIADDHPGMLKALQRLIAGECDVVATVHDGGSLLESAARLRPDVVIADLNMPIVGGLDACERLRRSNPTVKVILLSAMDDTEIAERALAAGASAFFVKYKLEPGQLIGTIRSVWRSMQLPPETRG